MRTLIENRFALVLLVVVAMAALFGVAEATRPAESAPAEQPATVEAAVESALRVCPVPEDGDTRVAAFTPPAETGDAPSLFAATALDGTESEIGTIGGPGQGFDAAADTEELVMRAEGPVAAGLTAVQTTTASGDLLSAPCAPPGLGFWYLAPGAGEVDDLDLHLVNVDDTPTRVHIDVYAAEGALQTLEGDTVEIEPHGRTVQSLNEISESAPVVAVHVRTTTGRVASGLLAADGSGSDWVPASGELATDVVIPGLPDGSGERLLAVASPGDSATVRISAIAEDGTFVPEDQEELEVPAGALATANLSGVLTDRAAAIRLSSDTPIAAGVLATGGGDRAFTAPVPPVTGTAVVPGNRSGDGFEQELLLAAPEGAAQVEVVPTGPDGAAGEPQRVEVPAGGLLPVEPAAPTGAESGFAALVRVLEGSSPIYVARVQRNDGGMTILPVPPAPVTVTLPHTSDTLTTVVE
ncbi:DUF5719 family protein [Allonocardiopsis opalescens]|uniref:Secreted protein n=1 Tax=Allonocardiopsis opalescens TaxID=1144618 RepID=A0A2T0QC15_9ACTN|nr:DUF5719 family protein [Allonocardiopsis opalescens]PRY01494.1 hypothetical protein CLV72_10176 [Allonocardiopsis opalescens]